MALHGFMDGSDYDYQKGKRQTTLGKMKLINSEVRIENTNHCNAKCIMCPRDEMTRPKTLLGLHQFKKLVDESKQLGADTISIFGFGEPLVDEHIVKKVQYCTDQGLETFITTNGSLLGGELPIKLLRAGLSHIRFSFHSFMHYNKVHKGLDFNTTLRNVQNFIARNRIQYNKQCKISVSVIPMFGEDIENIKYTWERNIDWLEIWKPHNWAGVKDYRGVTKERLKTCGRPFTGPVQINADGKMMVCCMDTNAELTVGDTYKNTIEEILKGYRFNEIRRKHTDGDLSGLICESCDQLNIEDESPLLYSSRDPDREINTTSSTKFKMEEKNGVIDN